LIAIISAPIHHQHVEILTGQIVDHRSVQRNEKEATKAKCKIENPFYSLR
jgi:hypothetical protein